jgi:hypothetical protein
VAAAGRRRPGGDGSRSDGGSSGFGGGGSRSGGSSSGSGGGGGLTSDGSSGGGLGDYGGEATGEENGGSSGGGLGDYGGWEKRTTGEEKTAAAKALREQRGLVGGAAGARSRHSSSLSRSRAVET